MTETVDTPIVVNASSAPDVTKTVLRDIAIVAAAFPILVKLIGARDLNGLLHWLQSSDGATVMAVVVPAALSAWRGWQTRRRKEALVTVAQAAPNSVAIVKGTSA